MWQRNMFAVRAEIEVGFRILDVNALVSINDGSPDRRSPWYPAGHARAALSTCPRKLVQFWTERGYGRPMSPRLPKKAGRQAVVQQVQQVRGDPWLPSV
jgi:hypothetical protein